MTLETLLDEWRAAHRVEPDECFRRYSPTVAVAKDSFLPDGIIDPAQYYAASVKILFIGKEANWYRPGERAAENMSQQPFWHREAAFGRTPETLFSKRLSLIANAMEHQNFQKVDTCHAGLRKTAVINLNKRGGFSACVWQTLEGYVRLYHDYISQQIALIDPDVVICCGSGVKWLLDHYVTLPTRARVIAVYHPSYFALSHEEYLRQLECAVRGTAWQPVSGNRRPDRPQGIIFDTNRTYSLGATFDMLTSQKISAYGSASKLVDSFRHGDYVMYYVKGRGVVAVGQVISDEAVAALYEGDQERYKMVRMLIPDAIPAQEAQLAAVSPGELKQALGHGFFYAATTKRPYLTEAECEKVIGLLCAKYAHSALASDNPSAT